MNNKTTTPRITLFGNLGAEPETITLESRTFDREEFDVVENTVVTREHTTPERQIRSVSIAVNGRGPNDVEIVRWIRLLDYEEHLAGLSKGDRIKATGDYRERPYVKDGEKKIAREMIVTVVVLQPKRPKAEAA
jgi:single-stranded DNA-binding protein